MTQDARDTSTSVRPLEDVSRDGTCVMVMMIAETTLMRAIAKMQSVNAAFLSLALGTDCEVSRA